MDLPIEIKKYIENELNDNNFNIQKSAKEISIKYRNNNGKGNRLLTKNDEAIAYAISRMPATFGAVSDSLEHVLDNLEHIEIKSLADIGAGTGAASIAANELIELESISCFEREKSMREIGNKIFQNYNKLSDKTRWYDFDINSNKIDEKFDLVITSYMLNEISIDKQENVVEELWNLSNKVLLIVEPGTVQGYRNIMNAKNKLLELGGKLISPCMCNECKLPKEDWCNFSCRVQRTKSHKQFKEGTSPFEDEKYMYIAIGKNKINLEGARIIRHPLIYSGYVKMKVCTKNGIQEMTISKKEKEIYKNARKFKAGDKIIRA